MNKPKTKSPSLIIIDARLWGIAHTGIGRYTENLIDNLPCDPHISVCLIVSPDNFGQPKLSKFRRFVAKYHPYSPLAQFEMFGLWWKIKPDLLHVTHSSIPVFWPGKMVVTFHDLIKHISRGKSTTTHNPGLYWIKYLGYLLIDKIALWRAVQIIVPSQYWKNELMHKFQLPGQKIVVTYEGVDQRIKPHPRGRDFGITQPFVVYTGNLYPHKNIEVVLQAVKLLKGQIKLAIVCARSVFTNRAEELVKSFNVSESVNFLGRLSDTDLSALYSQASAFVFPSLIEGFGLPGLEAMAVGLPVIAARASCLPEVYDNAALFFDPMSPQDLASKIQLLLSEEPLRQKLIAKGQQQVAKYSWAKMAKQTWAIYQNCLDH